MAGYYTIVSFCGGGIRGLMSAGILKRLADASSSILSGTSLFAGTSTGSGITSLLLAGRTPADIVDYFLTTEKNFFSKLNPITTGPGYKIDEVYLGQRLIHPLNPKLNSFKQSVLFTAFNVGASATPWGPVLYHNLPRDNHGDVGIADAVTASSAMPGMLGSWHGLIDGAFVDHDPSIAAISVAVANGIKLDDIALVDIGTGFMPNWIASDTSTWGALQWQNGDGNPANHYPALLVNGSVSPILNASLNGTSSKLTPHLLTNLLGERYVNLNPQIPYIPENATDTKDLDTLQAAAADVSIHAAVECLNRYWPAPG